MKKLVLFFTVAVLLFGIYPYGAYAEEAPQVLCAHVCGAEEECTGSAATCPHAQHTEGACASQQTPCTHPCGAEGTCAGYAEGCSHAGHAQGSCAQQKVSCAHACGTKEECTGDEATCPHAGHEASACTEESDGEDVEEAPAIVHTVRFFATQAEVATGAPVATASVADGATLAAGAFPGPSLLGLQENVQVTWCLANGGGFLLPDDTHLLYETATVVDAYPEVSSSAATLPTDAPAAMAPTVNAPPVNAPADDSIVVSGKTTLPSLAENTLWKYTESGTGDVRYYISGCTYTFATDTTLEQYLESSNNTTIEFAVGKKTAKKLELPEGISIETKVPSNSVVVLPGDDLFAGRLGGTSIIGWGTNDDGPVAYNTFYEYNTGSGKNKLFAQLGTPPPPTHDVKFAIAPSSGDYGTINPDLTGATFTLEENQALGALSGFTSPRAVVKDATGCRTYFEGWYANGVFLSSEPNYDFSGYTTTADVTIEARFARYDLLPQDAQLVYKWEGKELPYTGEERTHTDAEGTLYLRQNGIDEDFNPADYGLSVTHLSASASGTNVKRNAQLEIVGYLMEWNGSIALHQGGTDVTALYGPVLYEAGKLVIKPVTLTLDAQPATVKYDDAAVLTFTMDGTIPAKFRTGNGNMADLNALFGMTGTPWLTSGYDPDTWTGSPVSFDISFTQEALANTAVSASQTNYEVTLNGSPVSAGGGLTVTEAYMVTYFNQMADVTETVPAAKPYPEGDAVTVETGKDLLTHADYVLTGWRTGDSSAFYPVGSGAQTFPMPKANVDLFAVWAFKEGAFTLSGFNKEYNGSGSSTLLSGTLKPGDKVTYSLRNGSECYKYTYGTDTQKEYVSIDVVDESITVCIERPGVEPYRIENVSVVIRQRSATVTVYGNEGEYTGNSLYIEPGPDGNLFEIAGLLPNEQLSADSIDAINTELSALSVTSIDAGESEKRVDTAFNPALLELADGKSIDNYSVVLNEGELVLKPRPITYISTGASKMYDGEALYADEVLVYDGVFTADAGPTDADLMTNSSTVAAHTYGTPPLDINLGDGNGPVECGEWDNSFDENDIVISDQGGAPANSNFVIHTVFGSLKITERPVTLTAHSEGPYTADGTYYTVNGFDIEYSTAAEPDRGLLQGHVLSGVSAEGSSSEAGTHAVTFSDLALAVVTDSSVSGGTNLADNYDFQPVEGTLVLTEPDDSSSTNPPAPSSSAEPAPAAAVPAQVPASIPVSSSSAAKSDEKPGSQPQSDSADTSGGAAMVRVSKDPESKDGGEGPEGELLNPEYTPETESSWHRDNSWGLANLVASVLSVVLSTLLLIKLLLHNRSEEDGGQGKKRGLVWRILAMLAGIVPPIVFVTFENLAAPMIFVNDLTIWIIMILIIQVAAMLLLKRTSRKQAG